MGSTAQNVQYCLKEGIFDVLRDFSHELSGSSSKSLSLTEIVKGVMSTICRNQDLVKLTREYAERHNYYSWNR